MTKERPPGPEGYRRPLLSQYPTTTTLLSTEVSHLLQGQQKKINYSAPIRDIELKFRG